MFDSDSFRFARQALAEAAEIQRQLQPAIDQLRAAQPDPATIEYAHRAAAELASFNQQLASLTAFEVPNRSTDWLVMPPTARDEIRMLRETARDEIQMLREEVTALRQQLVPPPVEPVQPPPADEEWPHTEIKGFRL